jgi:hypothetical protein
VIPSNRIDPVGQSLANQLADLNDAGGGKEVAATAALNNIAWQASGNINHSFNDNWQISGTYMYYESEEPDNKYYTDILGETPVYDSGSAILYRDVNAIAINSTHIPSDDSVLTLRYGYTRFNDSPANPPFNASDAAAFGFDADQMATIGEGIQQFPYIDTEGYGVNDHTHGSWSSADVVYKSWEGSGVYSKFVGNQTLKIGAQYRNIGVDWFRASAMNFRFPQRFTAGPGSDGDGIATMLLGLSDRTRAETATPSSNRNDYYGGFIQDDWRVNDNLVLNLGLRLEHETGLGEVDDHMIYGWEYDDPYPISAGGLNLTGGVLYAGVDGNPSRTHDPPGLKVGPRAGFAYSLNDATVIRGGFGLFWAPIQYPGPTVEAFAATGFSAATSARTFDQGGSSTVSNPFPDGVNQPTGNSNGRLQNVGSGIRFIDQFRQHPYIQQWSVDIQRDLGSNVAVKIGYVGSKGTDLNIGGTNNSATNINQLDPDLVGQLGSSLNTQVPNPFFGNSAFGPISNSATVTRGQLLRPYPQYLDVFAQQVSSGRSRYDAIRLEVEKRFRGNWGARVNYTWSDQRDNVYESVDRLSDEESIVYLTGRGIGRFRSGSHQLAPLVQHQRDVPVPEPGGRRRRSPSRRLDRLGGDDHAKRLPAPDQAVRELGKCLRVRFSAAEPDGNRPGHLGEHGGPGRQLRQSRSLHERRSVHVRRFAVHRRGSPESVALQLGRLVGEEHRHR